MFIIGLSHPLLIKILAELYCLSTWDTRPRFAISWFLTMLVLKFPEVTRYFSSLAIDLTKHGLKLCTLAQDETILNHFELLSSDADDSLRLMSASRLTVPNSDALFAQLCISILLLAKQPHANYWSKYVTSRLGNYSGLGVNVSSGLLEKIIPKYAAAMGIHRYMFPLYGLKREVMDGLSLISTGNNYEGSCALTTLNLMQHAGLTQFVQIHNYLFICAHPFLRLPIARGEAAAFCKALEKWLALPEEERTYLKILKPNDQSFFLHRKRFPILGFAAMHAAYMEGQRTMINYQPYTEGLKLERNKQIVAILEVIQKYKMGSMDLTDGESKSMLTGIAVNHEKLAKVLSTCVDQSPVVNEETTVVTTERVPLSSSSVPQVL